MAQRPLGCAAMKSSTVFLARYIGVFSVIECGWMLLNRDAAMAVVADILQSPTWTFTYGLISLALGLAIVVGHNVWRGGVAPVTVTLLGWLILIRGVVLESIDPNTAQRALNLLRFAPFHDSYLVVVLVLGACLALAGYWPRRSKQAA